MLCAVSAGPDHFGRQTHGRCVRRATELPDFRSIPGIHKCFKFRPGELGRVVSEELLSGWRSSAQRNLFGIYRSIDDADSHSCVISDEQFRELLVVRSETEIFQSRRLRHL
jgi:hypothetical protein